MQRYSFIKERCTQQSCQKVKGETEFCEILCHLKVGSKTVMFNSIWRVSSVSLTLVSFLLRAIGAIRQSLTHFEHLSRGDILEAV